MLAVDRMAEMPNISFKDRLNEWTKKNTLKSYQTIYESLVFPAIDALYPAGNNGGDLAHQHALNFMGELDRSGFLCNLLQRLSDWFRTDQITEVGGVKLPSSLMLAAGFIKGKGFANEAEAMQAVGNGENIIPGLRSMSRLVVPVFGSYTPYPRMGNEGQTLIRKKENKSLQNRVGLKNPGTKAAAAYMAKHKDWLPQTYIINLAFNPEVLDTETQLEQMHQAMMDFLDQGIFPAAFEIANSCPNTKNNGLLAADLNMAKVVLGKITPLAQNYGTPVWYKVAPGKSSEYYDDVIKICSNSGVRAITGTNTMLDKTPDGRNWAGKSGKDLYQYTYEAIEHMMAARQRYGANLDIIACGGIMDKNSWRQYQDLGINAGQALSILIYSGPLAHRIIERS